MTAASDVFSGGSSRALDTPPWVHELNSHFYGFNTGAYDTATPLANGHNVSRYTASGLAPDQQAQIVLLFAPTGAIDAIGAGPTIRGAAGAATCYAFVAYSGQTKIVKFVAGTPTDLATGGTAAVLGDNLRIRAVGATITGYVNGREVLSVVDTAITSGDPGIYGNGSSMLVDDFTAIDVLGALLPALPSWQQRMAA